MAANFDAARFPYARFDADPGVWRGTVMLDKPDAAGTYYRRNRVYDPATGRFTQEDPAGLAGGLNLYGFAAGDPVNFSDPFGLFGCTVQDWTDCQLVSLTAGWGWGMGVKGQLGPIEIQGDVAHAGVEGSVSLTASGHAESEGEGTASIFSGHVRAGTKEAEVSVADCGTKSGCYLGSVGIKNVTGASNGDISAKVHVGVELGVTFHAGQTLTAIRGAAGFAWTLASQWIWRHVGTPDGTLGSSDVPPQ